MYYYSTNKKTSNVSLEEAVVKGLAPDKGLYMPETIRQMPRSFFENIEDLSLQEIAYQVALNLFGNDVDKKVLEKIVHETLNFKIPLAHVSKNIYSLELFHGPTLAFKDVGSRFMARLLAYFLGNKKQEKVNVLVATSGDTGSAVANGFLDVEGIHVYVLYPKDKVSHIQESQFVTLGRNITALEIDGTFDDCQALVKSAFTDEELNKMLVLTSANSINIARFLPQAFYYFYAFAQLKKIKRAKNVVISVPSGNLGNLTAGLIAQKMGLPIKYFIAANNSNDVFFEYLQTGEYKPRLSEQTIANAMDVGNPSNFERILDLYKHSWKGVTESIKGRWYADKQITEAIKQVFKNESYLLDPHGACAYLGLQDLLQDDENGIFLETAHPAKFVETMEVILNRKVDIPIPLQKFMNGKKKSIQLSKEYDSFRNFLLNK